MDIIPHQVKSKYVYSSYNLYFYNNNVSNDQGKQCDNMKVITCIDELTENYHPNLQFP